MTETHLMLAETSIVPWIAGGAVLVVLALGLVVASFGRKGSREGTGMLARETYQRDKASQVEVKEEVLVGASGREIERAARIERIGGELVPKEKGDLAPFVPPD